MGKMVNFVLYVFHHNKKILKEYQKTCIRRVSYKLNSGVGLEKELSLFSCTRCPLLVPVLPSAPLKAALCMISIWLLHS